MKVQRKIKDATIICKVSNKEQAKRIKKLMSKLTPLKFPKNEKE